MNNQFSNRIFLSAAVAGTLLVVPGCATKKYVRQQVDPVNTRVGSLEGKVGEQGTELENVNSSLSKTREQLSDVDRKAGEANAAAARANENATAAGRRADEAMTAANTVNSRVDSLGRTIENMANFSEMAKDSVYFAFGKSELTDEGKAKLDELATRIGSTRQYVIEVFGYTDTTGSSTYNQELSAKRANAVVRYLTSKNIPLRAIHVIGIGEAQQAQAEMAGMSRAERRRATVEERKQSRRVDVTVYVPGANAPASQAANN